MTETAMKKPSAGITYLPDYAAEKDAAEGPKPLNPRRAETVPGFSKRKRVVRCSKRTNLCVVVYPPTKKKGTVRRTYAIQIRNGLDGKQELHSIGKVGAPEWPWEAVVREWEIQRGKARGAEPQSISRRTVERVKAGTAMTFTEATERYIAEREIEDPPLAATSKIKYRRCLRLLNLGFGEDTNIWEIDDDQVKAAYLFIIKESHKRVRGRTKGTASAYNAMRFFKVLWNHFKSRSMPSCPIECLGKRLKKPAPRQFKTTPQFVHDYWETAAQIPYPKHLQSVIAVWALFLRTIMFVGCRRTEWTRLEWSWVDLKHSVITLPARVTKTKEEHAFPIGTAVTRMLAEHRKAQDADYAKFRKEYPISKLERTARVFAYPYDTRYPGRGCNWPEPIVRKHCKLLPHKEMPDGSKKRAYMLHDNRRIYSDALDEVGVPERTQYGLTNHAISKNDVHGNYKHPSVRMMRPYQQKVENLLMEWIGDPEAATAKLLKEESDG